MSGPAARRLRGWRGGSIAVAMAALLGALAAAAVPAGSGSDTLGRELERARGRVQSRSAAGAGERSQRLGQAFERAAAAWQQGRHHLALQRFAPVLVDLETAAFLRGLGAPGGDASALLEAEWARQGTRLAALRDEASGGGPLGGVRPAAVRAVGEAALLQARGYHAASLPYGKATEPQQGLYYLGSAAGQQALVDLTLRLAEPSAGAPPGLRSIAPEIAALETEMLGLYRPPAAIDRHADFIVASATLEEARALDEAGLRHGALLRYLEAALQMAPIRPGAATAAGDLREALARHGSRFAADPADHSLGRIFLEAAEADLAAADAAGTPAIAAAIAGDVLPRYFAVLSAPPSPEARPGAPLAATQVAVTLLRWPYT